MVELTSIIETRVFHVGNYCGEDFLCDIQFKKEEGVYDIHVWTPTYSDKMFLCGLPEFSCGKHFTFDEIAETIDYQDWTRIAVDYMNRFSEYTFEIIEEDLQEDM